MPSEASGSVKTFFVFMDLPKHVEYKVHPMPLVPEGTVLRIDRISLRDPSDRRRVRIVEGEYTIMNKRLVYSTSSGLLQYLELSPAT
jgi:hypothetical protein